MSAADFIAACHDIFRERRAGVLDVQAEGIRTFLYFREGVLVFAEEGTLGETLGRILVRRGTLSAAQYAAILERMTEGLIQSEQARFGEVAIELGFLTPEQVDAALREQVGRKFLHCVQWEISTCEFREGDEEIGGLPRYPTPFEPLLLEGIRQHFDDERCAAVLGPVAELYPAVRGEVEELARRFRLDARGLRLLRMLDGARPLRGVLEAAPAGLETRPLLVALTVSNALRLTAEAVAPRQVEAAPAAVEPRRRQESVVAFIPRPPSPPAAAREPPSRPPPPSTDVRVARLEAECAFQAGRRHLAEQSWTAAARELRRAATLFPEPLEYGLAAAWAELRAGVGDDWKVRREELRRLADRAAAQDRGLALAHHVIGHLASLEGEAETARRALETALSLEPGNVDAQRTLRLVHRRASAGKAAPAVAAAPARRTSKGDQGASDRIRDEVMVARSSGKLDVAIGMLRTALASDADNALLSAELALCLLLADPRRNAREANGLARQARKLDAHLALPWVVAGMLLEPLGERERAAQMYGHALSLDPECADAQSALDRLGAASSP